MKVGIVGAGLAGLVCAYELTKQGIEVVLYESQPYAGGKMRYNIGNINKSALYTHTNALIAELGLGALYGPQKMQQMAMLKGKKFIKLENAERDTRRWAPKKVKQYDKHLKEYLATLDFDIFNPSEEVKRLRTISFAEFAKDTPNMERLYAFSAPMDFLFEDDTTKIAADLAAYAMVHGFDAARGESYVFEENLMPMALVLEDIIINRGATIHFNSVVERVVRTAKNGFEILYTKRDEQHQDSVDKVVMTQPLPLTRMIMPELDITSDVVYKPVMIYLTRGELRHPERIQIVGMQAKDKGNIRIFSASLEYEHVVIPYDPEKEVDFSILYKHDSCEIIKKQYLGLGWPVRGPNARVPELATNVDGVYLCGDFYYYTLMEVPIRTAQKVAEMINETTGESTA
jgi:thioredoxin reductase